MAELQRILCVEGDEDVQDVVKLALGLVGKLTVHVCSSGEAALAEAVAIAPDMILLDVTKPEMDGPATLQKLRQLPELANVPVAFMSVKTLRHDVEKYKSMGAVGIIPKPLDMMKLPSQVRALWDAHNGVLNG